MGSESLNWRSTEPEVPPAECNTESVRSQTHSPSQVAGTTVGSNKVESVADHHDYVAFLRTSKNPYTYAVYEKYNPFEILPLYVCSTFLHKEGGSPFLMHSHTSYDRKTLLDQVP